MLKDENLFLPIAIPYENVSEIFIIVVGKHGSSGWV